MVLLFFSPPRRRLRAPVIAGTYHDDGRPALRPAIDDLCVTALQRLFPAVLVDSFILTTCCNAKSHSRPELTCSARGSIPGRMAHLHWPSVAPWSAVRGISLVPVIRASNYPDRCLFRDGPRKIIMRTSKTAAMQARLSVRVNETKSDKTNEGFSQWPDVAFNSAMRLHIFFGRHLPSTGQGQFRSHQADPFSQRRAFCPLALTGPHGHAPDGSETCACHASWAPLSDPDSFFGPSLKSAYLRRCLASRFPMGAGVRESQQMYITVRTCIACRTKEQHD